MVKFQTTAQIAAYCLAPERQVKDLQKDLKKVMREKEQADEKAEQEREKAEKAQLEKERTLERGVLVMLAKSIDREFIVTVFNITLEDIDSIQEKYKEKEALEKLLNDNVKS